MRTPTWILLIAIFATVLWTLPATAQGRADVLKELVPPPRLILRYQDELGLTDEQKDALKQVLKDAQAASLDLEFAVQEEAQKLAKMIAADKIDVDRALKQADKLMAAETALKRVKLEMMLKTKALLTSAQLKKIDEFRDAQRNKRQERRGRLCDQ